MTDLPPLSRASRMVLSNLARTDGKALMKGAIKELVQLGIFDMERVERRVRLRSKPQLVLVPTGATVPCDSVLLWARRAVAGAPRQHVGMRAGMELGAVAEAIAKGDPKAAKSLVGLVLADLQGRGLVRSRTGRLLGLFERTTWERTPEGDAELGETASPRRSRGGRDSNRDDPTARRHASGEHDERAVDDDMDADVDAGFDSSFDSSFDSAFDSSFDSGFSDGGGGGGDSGGGGGGDGGGGGGG